MKNRKKQQIAKHQNSRNPESEGRQIHGDKAGDKRPDKTEKKVRSENINEKNQS